MNWNLYFFVKLDDIKAILESNIPVLVFFGFIFAVAASMLYFFNIPIIEEYREKYRKAYWKHYRNFIFFGIMLLIIFCFGNIVSSLLPSTGQMAAIYFGDAALKSETAEIVQRMPPKFAKILNNKLDEWILENKSIEIIKENKEEK